MREFFLMICSDIYKMVHTRLLWVHLFAPFLGIALAGGYLLQSAWEETEKIMAYVQFVSIAFPFMITVVVTMLFEAEKAAGKFQNILFVPGLKILSHAGNILALFLFGIAAQVLALCGFGAAAWEAELKSLPVPFYGILAVCLMAFNIAVYCIQYMICFTWGQSISMGLGITGTLLSAMLMFQTGDRIWKACPYSYGNRMLSYFLYQYLKPEQYGLVREDYHTGMAAVMCVTIGIVVLFFVWSSKWEGTAEGEE